MRKDKMGASASQTGPSQAEPEVSALRASVPSAGDVESIEAEIARLVALHGLGTISGATRFDPPTEEWNRSEWRERILGVIPSAAEFQCKALASDIVRAILRRSNVREIDDGIRTAPRFAADQIRKLNPGMHGLTMNLDRLSNLLDTFAVVEVASGIAARSDETPTAAQPEGQEPGPQSGDAQSHSPPPEE